MEKGIIKDVDYTISNSSGVNYTNMKGFYEVLTQLIYHVSKSRLAYEFNEWINALDMIRGMTGKWWTNPDKLKEYDDKYYSLKQKMTNTTSAGLNSTKQQILTFAYDDLRKLTILVFDNISHIMLKDNTDDDDSSWLLDGG